MLILWLLIKLMIFELEKITKKMTKADLNGQIKVRIPTLRINSWHEAHNDFR